MQNTSSQVRTPSGKRLQLGHFVPRLQKTGGAEALLVTFASSVRDAGVDLTVITTRDNEPTMVREIEAHGGRVVSFRGTKLVDPVRLAKIIRFVHKVRFDVIHTHLTEATILGTVAGRFCGVPVVTTLHNAVMDSQTHLYHGRLETWLLKHMVTEVIAVGDQTAAAHKDLLGQKSITVIPNAVRAAPTLAADERHALRQEMVGADDACLLVWAGRLEPQKGLLDLLGAFALLRRLHGDVRLCLVGRGSLVTELSSRVVELGLDDAVRFLGLRTDVPRLLAASDIYVSASHWEGLPITILEAMSAALPVVATDVGDVSAALGDGAGVLVQPRDPQALADALANVVADVGLQRSLGRAAKARIGREYSSESWTQKLLQVYHRLVGAQAIEATAARGHRAS